MRGEGAPKLIYMKSIEELGIYGGLLSLDCITDTVTMDFSKSTTSIF